jgi:hypothetical protein
LRRTPERERYPRHVYSHYLADVPALLTLVGFLVVLYLLIAAGGLYRELYNAQFKGYVSTPRI